MVYVTWPRPLQGWFAIHGLSLAMISACTKFEVSISTHNLDMTGDTNYRKWVVWDSWGSLKVTGNSACHVTLTTPFLKVVCHPKARIWYVCNIWRSSFSRSRDIVGAKNLKWVTWPWPRPFQAWFVILMLGLAVAYTRIQNLTTLASAVRET